MMKNGYIEKGRERKSKMGIERKKKKRRLFVGEIQSPYPSSRIVICEPSYLKEPY